MFKHILVPTDGSELSQDTAPGGHLCQEAGARITAFYAKPAYPVIYYGEGALIDSTTPEQFAELAEQQATEILNAAEALCKNEGVDCSRLALTCDVPYEGIIEDAAELRPDFHGFTWRGLTDILLGSETHKVLTHSSAQDAGLPLSLRSPHPACPARLSRRGSSKSEAISAR